MIVAGIIVMLLAIYLTGGIFFFRHRKHKGRAGSQSMQFGEKYLYIWWKRACQSLGIQNVDLYGGTRHSSVRAMIDDIPTRYSPAYHVQLGFARGVPSELQVLLKKGDIKPCLNTYSIF